MPHCRGLMAAIALLLLVSPAESAVSFRRQRRGDPHETYRSAALHKERIFSRGIQPSVHGSATTGRTKHDVSEQAMQPEDEMFITMPGELPPSKVGEVLYFELPAGNEISCEVTRVYDHPTTGSRTLYGAIGLAESPAGSCSITCGRLRGGDVSCMGNVRPTSMPQSQYEIRSKGNGQFHTLTEVPYNRYEENEDVEAVRRRLANRHANSTLFPLKGPKTSYLRRLADTNNIMDIMVVYTQKVEDALGSAEAAALWIAHGVDESNMILERSQINLRIRPVLVTKMSNTAYDDPDDLSTTLYEAANYGSSYAEFDTEQATRYTVGADALAILTYPTTPNSCGIAFLNGGVSSSSSLQISVTELSCFAGYYSFIHEIGHNLGSTHDASTGAVGMEAYSHGWCWEPADAASSCANSDCRRSVMAYASCVTSPYSCTSCPRYPYFSNPDVYESGTPTGDATEADNARSINEAASYAVALEDSLQTGGIIFSVNPTRMPVDTGCFEVTISGWELGDGSDITGVTLAGVAAVEILEQGPHYVVISAGASSNAGQGDVVITRSGGGETSTLIDGFEYVAAGAVSFVDTFDGSSSLFYRSGHGSYYLLDSACDTSSGGVCQNYGPATGDGMFLLTRPDGIANEMTLTANFSVDEFCSDTITAISVDYFAFSIYSQCYTSNFLSIEGRAEAGGAWSVLGQTSTLQTANTDAWNTLAATIPGGSLVLYGIRIVVNSYSAYSGCNSYNPVGLDNIAVSYSTSCTGGCSAAPTGQPTSQPSAPTPFPTGIPTAPTPPPSGQPSSQPSGQPSRDPSSQPTCIPSGSPSGQPTCRPSQPTGAPTSSQPTGAPSSSLPTGAPVVGAPGPPPSREIGLNRTLEVRRSVSARETNRRREGSISRSRQTKKEL